MCLFRNSSGLLLEGPHFALIFLVEEEENDDLHMQSPPGPAFQTLSVLLDGSVGWIFPTSVWAAWGFFFIFVRFGASLLEGLI